MATPFVPQVAVVDFHHARGPEVEFWVQPTGKDLFDANDWSLLPFLALADGAHAVEEEFSYFTLLAKGDSNASIADGGDAVSASTKLDANSSTNPHHSLFGIACMRQIRSDKLKVKSPEVTRSTVQKAIIVVLEKPGKLGEVRERLGAVTGAWFAQADFTDTDVLKDFQESLVWDATSRKHEPEHYIGLSLREMIYEFRHQTLVLFKALLLQKKILFFGSRCERMCLLQFALISLIPNLIHTLQDSADPTLDSYAKTITRAGSLRTSERSSLLAYMGLPLDIFGTSSFFSPYTPLQLLDLLMSGSTHSFVVGSTNNLLLSQKDRYADVLVNLDEEVLASKVQILDPNLRTPLSLSAADRRWIDNVTQTVVETWDPLNPSRPTTHGYSGSEDAIRLQFEEYLLSLCSSAAYKIYLDSVPFTPASAGAASSAISTTSATHESYADPTETAYDFNPDFLGVWRTTPNYALLDKLTRDAAIFDIIPPKHPTAGALNIEDVQRRLAQGVAELHLDERVREGRETMGRVIGEGRERVGAGVARFWKEVEGFKERRDASRPRGGSKSSNTDVSQLKDNINGFDGTQSTNQGAGATSTATGTSPTTSDTAAAGSAGTAAWFTNVRDRASKVQIQRPDINTAQLSSAAKENAARAGAYLSSWGSWAKDRSRDWSEKRNQPQSSGQGGGSGTGSGTIGNA